MNKNYIIAGAAAVIAAVAIGAYTLLFENMTGATWQEIQDYRTQHPNTTVTYKIRIDDTLTVRHSTTSVTVTDAAQVTALAENSEYLQGVELIRFGDITMTGDMYALLTLHFPQAKLEYAKVSLLGKDYPADTATVDLSHLTKADAEEAGLALRAFPALKEVDMMGGQEVSPVSPETASLLASANPDAPYQYATELFGQIVSADMEKLEYFQVEIGDEGLTQIRQLLPIMRNLTYLKLDWCGTTDEATAQLREECKELGIKVVWRVFFGPDFNLLTDSYKLWATWSLTDNDIDCFKYLNEVKYLDLGHNYFSHVDFMRYMPDVETCILACGKLQDLSGIAGCKKITYLELLDNQLLQDDDLQVLKELPNVQYLNISNIKQMRDLSFTDHMPLRRLWATCWKGGSKEANRVKALHPDAHILFMYDGDAVSYGWRYTKASGYQEKTPEYALICARFDYAHYDFARYPRGYLREEITYESLGLTPS